MKQTRKITIQEPQDYSKDDLVLTVDGVGYPLHEDGSISLLSCPQTIEKTFKRLAGLQ